MIYIYTYIHIGSVSLLSVQGDTIGGDPLSASASASVSSSSAMMFFTDGLYSAHSAHSAHSAAAVTRSGRELIHPTHMPTSAPNTTVVQMRSMLKQHQLGVDRAHTVAIDPSTLSAYDRSEQHACDDLTSIVAHPSPTLSQTQNESHISRSNVNIGMGVDVGVGVGEGVGIGVGGRRKLKAANQNVTIANILLRYADYILNEVELVPTVILHKLQIELQQQLKIDPTQPLMPTTATATGAATKAAAAAAVVLSPATLSLSPKAIKAGMMVDQSSTRRIELTSPQPPAVLLPSPVPIVSSTTTTTTRRRKMSNSLKKSRPVVKSIDQSSTSTGTSSMSEVNEKWPNDLHYHRHRHHHRHRHPSHRHPSHRHHDHDQDDAHGAAYGAYGAIDSLSSDSSSGKSKSQSKSRRLHMKLTQSGVCDAVEPIPSLPIERQANFAEPQEFVAPTPTPTSVDEKTTHVTNTSSSPPVPSSSSSRTSTNEISQDESLNHHHGRSTVDAESTLLRTVAQVATLDRPLLPSTNQMNLLLLPAEAVTAIISHSHDTNHSNHFNHSNHPNSNSNPSLTPPWIDLSGDDDAATDRECR